MRALILVGVLAAAGAVTGLRAEPQSPSSAAGAASTNPSQSRAVIATGCLEGDAPPGGTPRFKLTTLDSVIAVSPTSNRSQPAEPSASPTAGAAPSRPRGQVRPAAPGGYRLVSTSPSMDFAAHLGEKVQVTGTYVVLVPGSAYATGVAAMNPARNGDTTIGTFTVTSIRSVASSCR